MLDAMKRTNIQRIWTCLWLAVAVLMHSGLHAQTYDGRDYNGRPCVQGNYVWKLIYSAVDYPGVLRSEIGSVLLLR